MLFRSEKSDSIYIGYVLSGLGIGLVAFSINIILVRAFNAFEDTRTQVLSILLINVISVALSYLSLVVLQYKWVTVGLGLAFSISYISGLFVTLSLLGKHTGKLTFSDFSAQHLRLFVAALLAMSPLFILSQYFSWADGDSNTVVRASELLVVMVVGFGGFIFVAKLMKVSEITKMTTLTRVQLQKIRNR